jgi:hypothetical protein
MCALHTIRDTPKRHRRHAASHTCTKILLVVVSASNKRNFFCPIVIDPEAKQWWDGRKHKIFEEHEWLKNKIYWELIERNHPATFNGDMRPQYAAAVRDYAWKLAASILPSQTPPRAG